MVRIFPPDPDSTFFGRVSSPFTVGDLSMPITAPPSKKPDESAVVERAMQLNIMAGSVGVFWIAVAFGMPLPLFLEAVRASGQQIGIVGAIRQLAMLWQVPAALLVERMPRRKPFWAIACSMHRLMWGVPALLPFVLPGRPELYAIVTMVALAISDVLANLSWAAWMSWM